MDWFQLLEDASSLIQEASLVLTDWWRVHRLFNSVWGCPDRVVKDTYKLLSFRVVRPTCELLTQPAFMVVARAR